MRVEIKLKLPNAGLWRLVRRAKSSAGNDDYKLSRVIDWRARVCAPTAQAAKFARVVAADAESDEAADLPFRLLR